jgi:nitrite reductase (NO-forming)
MENWIFKKTKAAGNRIDRLLVENNIILARFMEIIFGVIWILDGSFLLQKNFVTIFTNIILTTGQNQPAFLAGWFSFWSGIILPNAYTFMYMIAFLEFMLAVSLILGLGRKIGYAGGFILSILLWAIPEGFGGPYNSGVAEIGTGIIYAIVFIFLAITSSIHGRNKYTADYYIEKKADKWKYIAEINY